MRENIRVMFASATLKLTLWYLAILLIISLIFSVTIYYISSSQLAIRLNTFENRLQDPALHLPTNFDFSTIRERQTTEAKAALIVALFYVNVAILVAGGFGSLYLARRTLEPIEKAHDAQTRFTSDASHELRTPLAIMKSEMEVALRDHTIQKRELKDVLTSNLEEVNRLSELSNMLLQLSRSEEDELDRQPLNVTACIEAAVPKTLQKRVHITAPDKPVMLVANEPSLVELFHILFDNALRYSSAFSPINVKLVKARSAIIITIENDGKGITANDLPHVFTRFYRADTSRSQAGYGLGLSLAEKIVSIHDGTITIDSVPDKTTVVTVKLPRS